MTHMTLFKQANINPFLNHKLLLNSLRLFCLEEHYSIDSEWISQKYIDWAFSDVSTFIWNANTQQDISSIDSNFFIKYDKAESLPRDRRTKSSRVNLIRLTLIDEDIKFQWRTSDRCPLTNGYTHRSTLIVRK